MTTGAPRIEVKEIAFSSNEYQSAVALRTKVLRDPLGLKFSADDLARESADIHIGAFSGQDLVGCLILSPYGPASAPVFKMRQVAVHPSRQGCGIGKMLVDFSELVAHSRGARGLVLSARETAVAFYLRLGYEIVGEPFIEVTLSHRKMQKSLLP